MKIFKNENKFNKKDLVNLVYMQIGFSKQIAENLIDEFFSLIYLNIKMEKKVENI